MRARFEAAILTITSSQRAHYPTAPSTVYGVWKDSEMRAWLVDNGYLRSDAQVKRDELIKLMHEKFGSHALRPPYQY
jgi:hypothetical protein